MVKFASFTFQERVIVKGIVRRAVQMGIYNDPLDAEMDISATYAHCPLRLEELRDADDFNFGHDMAGIQQHLNRQTGNLEGFFLPRFARGDNE